MKMANKSFTLFVYGIRVLPVIGHVWGMGNSYTNPVFHTIFVLLQSVSYFHFCLKVSFFALVLAWESS
jgi:hypothetical protein